MDNESKPKELKSIPFDPSKIGRKAVDIITDQNSVKQTAARLYDKLNSLYASVHFDGREEKIEAVNLLEKAIKNGVHPNQILFKMKQLEEKVEFKTKLFNVINGKFWEREFVKPITYHEYDPKKFL